MADHAPRTVETHEQERAETTWISFVKVSKVVIIGTVLVLILMALFLL